ncbi:hypothetical protein HDU67_001909 [Dinochytrium kinnereticum]|nr:hypothetical protein HDU67_001909 [Dinochytrium kinnereticum]
MDRVDFTQSWDLSVLSAELLENVLQKTAMSFGLDGSGNSLMDVTYEGSLIYSGNDAILKKSLKSFIAFLHCAGDYRIPVPARLLNHYLDIASKLFASGFRPHLVLLLTSSLKNLTISTLLEVLTLITQHPPSVINASRALFDIRNLLTMAPNFTISEDPQAYHSLLVNACAIASAYIGDDLEFGITEIWFLETLLKNPLFSIDKCGRDLISVHVMPFFVEEAGPKPVRSSDQPRNTWKTVGSGSTHILQWLLDDHEPRYKSQGISLIGDFLQSADAISYLNRSLYNQFKSLRPCLTYLSNPELFNAALLTMQALVIATEPDESPARLQKLEILLEEGIIRGLSMSIGTKAEIPLLSLIVEVLRVHEDDLAIVEGCCDAMDELIAQCWPRLQEKFRAIAD